MSNENATIRPRRKKRVAVFTGSFDPFTIGHKSIVDRAIGMFDTLIIGIGINTSKTPWMPLEERLERIRAIYADEPKVKVMAFDGLATRFARENGARYILRGVRSVADFEYERDMAEINRLLTEDDPIETIFIPSLPKLAAVSSSLVRELDRFGIDYSRLIP